MAKSIFLTTPECGVTNGMELSFRAPCDCNEFTDVRLGDVSYDLVDASGNSLTSCSGYFANGAILTVIIDTANGKATLLNPQVNNYTKSLGTSSDTASGTGTTVWARVKQIESDLTGKSGVGHKHTTEDIINFPTALPASDVYAWAKASTKPEYKASEIKEFPTSLPASDVPAWAKASTKPSYDASEIDNMPTTLPASDVYAWAKAKTKPSYTASEVGAIPAYESGKSAPTSLATGKLYFVIE